MNKTTIATIVHALAIVSGLCSLLAVALTQPPFSLPPIWAGAFALTATVCGYVGNQLPSLGGSADPAPTPPAA